MKPKLLLLHGALGNKRQFDSLRSTLERAFELYDLDFEGHGESASTQEFSMDLFVENVVHQVKSHELTPVNIFGYSMGGYVALCLAHQNPDLVNKIMTLGTKFDWTRESATKEVKMLNPDKIAEKVPHFADKLKKDHPCNDWKEVVYKTGRMMQGLGNGKNLSIDDLKQINHKVLICLGTQDEMVTVAESESAANALPNGSLMMIENFRHPLEKVDVQKLTEDIKKFF